jgi:beta-N-acetylhexosaminidase
MLNEMTLEQKIGQVLVIGFDGQALHPELHEMIERYHLGGLVLFARNVASPAQVAQLACDVQNAARSAGLPGLLLAIDQEGGRVARLTEDNGFTEFPSAMALGATGHPDYARQAAAAIALELRAVGLNANFAPVLDVNNNTANPVIGTRSFSFDPQRAADYGVAFLNGLQEERIMAFGKHFPGHGNTQQDSHFSLPVVDAPREALEAVELLPFRAAIRAGVAGIMTAHISFPALEPDGLPATLSQRVLRDLLRDDLGFDGLLATDSLEMGALERAGYPAPLAAAAALRAGADLLLFNHGHEMHRQAFETIRAWLADGRIPLARLDEAVERVLRAKQRYGLLEPVLPDPRAAAEQCGTPAHRALSRHLAARSICLLRDPAARVPLIEGAGGLVIEIPSARGLGARLGLPVFEVPEDPDEKVIQGAVAAALSSLASARARTLPGSTGTTPSAIVVGLALTTPGPAAGVLHAVERSQGQVRLIHALAAESLPLILVALRNPFDLSELLPVTSAANPPGVNLRNSAWLATLGDWGPSLDALADVLLGRAAPQGEIEEGDLL